jgi:hypothetical protein
LNKQRKIQAILGKYNSFLKFYQGLKMHVSGMPYPSIPSKAFLDGVLPTRANSCLCPPLELQFVHSLLVKGISLFPSNRQSKLRGP